MSRGGGGNFCRAEEGPESISLNLWNISDGTGFAVILV